MKYDDASWHYGGDFPSDLPPQAGATHIAMFVCWAALNGLIGELHRDELNEELAKLISREITPTNWFLQSCDEKFTDEDLNEEGNFFATAYYGDENSLHTKQGSYVADYVTAFADRESLYHVPDGWESYDVLSPIISARFLRWRVNK